MTALTLKDPFTNIFSAFDRGLESVFDSTSLGLTPQFKIPVDVQETDDGYVIRADLPGVDRKDVSVEVKDGVITISAERKQESKSRKDGYDYRERSVGSYSRSFRLPDNVKVSDVTAALKDGVLDVSLRRTPESKPRSITVN